MEQKRKKMKFDKDMLLHFSCNSSLKNLGEWFHQTWQEIFEETPLDDMPIIYANRLTDSFRHLLVKERPSKEAIRLPPARQNDS